MAMTTTILGIEPDQDDADVARMLREAADRREAELNAAWQAVGEAHGAADAGRDYVRNLRDAADYHERQAQRRRHLNEGD
jgi:hypothetical protein